MAYFRSYHPFRPAATEPPHRGRRDALSGSFRPMRQAAAALLACLMVTAGGCDPQSTQNTSREDMLGHYESGRYEEAFDAALPRVDRGSRADRDHARYVAGVSAYRLGRNSEAIRHLRPLTSHRDRELAGRANATLGLVHLNRRQDERAVEHLRQAADRLTGEDRAHAYYHLALAQQRLGQWTHARTSLSNAMNHTRDADFRAEIQQRIATTGFTIQLGAFSSRSNADNQARQMRSAASAAGLGTPRVVPSRRADGSRLYLVQAGSFATFDSALSARRRLGRTDVIVTLMRE